MSFVPKFQISCEFTMILDTAFIFCDPYLTFGLFLDKFIDFFRNSESLIQR